MLSILYIDPGTGSALFSIAIGVAATLFFVFQALWIRLKTFILGGKALKISKHYHDYVIYCEGRQYVNVFKPVLEEFESRGIELLYLTGAEDDPAMTAGYVNIKCEYIGEGNRAFARLNFLSAGIVLITTPGLDVFQLRRSKNVKHYMHILHAISDFPGYTLFGHDYFDSILLTADYQKNMIRKLERIRNLPQKQLIVAGCTYLDVFAEKIKQIPQEEKKFFTVLVSPSWGESALLSRYGERLLDPLAKTGWRIIVRPHPQSRQSEKSLLAKLQQKYENIPAIEWNYDSENIFVLAKSDVMISDFSGIIFDYIALFNKPVIYANEKIDLRPYNTFFLNKEDYWPLNALKRFGIELKEENFEFLRDIITRAVKDKTMKEARKWTKDNAWQHQGGSGKIVADYMIQVKGGL
ncbi:MAG: CDP-glycerol glycerophosphotransferase family protein [Spirochaetaceae bacterium]|jgi:hypothetical protein|nr:CDP-glycerol glycerophosphotransferase family protein [Spirochaetaceae bacterium]